MGSLELLVDPLFRMGFLSGLVVALVTPAVGLYLRLRGEWLAALALAQVAGAGGVLAALVAVPPMAGAVACALVAVAAKGTCYRAGNDAYAVLILLGWSAMLIGGELSHSGHMVGRSLMDGQLYFATWVNLATALGVAVVVIAALPLLSRRLLRDQLFPGHDRANGRAVWPVTLGFDLVAALTIAVAATSVGLFGAFALVFVPGWIAFGVAPSWRWALIMASGIGVSGYLAAFVGAVLLDLPFGPVLVASLLACLPLRLLGRRLSSA